MNYAVLALLGLQHLTNPITIICEFGQSSSAKQAHLQMLRLKHLFSGRLPATPSSVLPSAFSLVLSMRPQHQRDRADGFQAGR